MKYIDILLDIMNKGITGIILGVIFGFFTSLYFESRKKLVYQSNVKKYKINQSTGSYKGVPIEKLYMSTITIWNAGNQVIKSNDIVMGYPIKLQFSENAIILEREIVRRTKESNGCEINLSGRDILFDFYYLNPRDGLTVSIIHAGKEKPKVLGEIIGISRIKDYGNISFEFNRLISSKKSGVFFLVSGVFMYSTYQTTGFIASIPFGTGTVYTLIFNLICCLILSITSFFFSNRSIPKELRLSSTSI